MSEERPEAAGDVIARVVRLPIGLKLAPARIGAAVVLNGYLDRVLVPLKWVLAGVCVALGVVAALVSHPVARPVAIGLAITCGVAWVVLVLVHAVVRRVIWRLAVPRALRNLVAAHGGDWEGMLEEAGVPTGPVSLMRWLWRARRHPEGVGGQAEDVWRAVWREVPELLVELERESDRRMR